MTALLISLLSGQFGQYIVLGFLALIGGGGLWAWSAVSSRSKKIADMNEFNDKQYKKTLDDNATYQAKIDELNKIIDSTQSELSSTKDDLAAKSAKVDELMKATPGGNTPASTFIKTGVKTIKDVLTANTK